MKHLVVLSVVIASSLGGVEVEGIFKENAFIPPSIRDAPSLRPRLGADCTPPTVEDCRGNANMHPWPCNCHKYFQCDNGEVIESDCVPYNLIFNPLTEQCENEFTAPPGLCQDTPDPSSSTTATPTAPTTTTPKPTTTPAPTTTPRPTTTQQPTTTTPRNCWICPGCTCDASTDLDGFFKPYPGNCHWYYQCVHSVDDPDCEWSSVGPFDCGDWAFNPHQASCTWPELVPDCN